MIGALRMAMARTAVTRLAPDLVILDEFQRFKDLFPGARSRGDEHYSDAQKLAQKIIMHPSAKSLVLSATPYKMFTLPDELDAEDHHQDFHDTIAFSPVLSVRLRSTSPRVGMLEGTDGVPPPRRPRTCRGGAAERASHRAAGSAAGRRMLREMEMPFLELRPGPEWPRPTRSDVTPRHGHVEFWRLSPSCELMMSDSRPTPHLTFS